MGGGGGEGCADGPARPTLCSDQRMLDRCSQFGLSYAAMCYETPGGDPLPELAGQFPSYGCEPPAEFNSGEGGAWTFWCCSKLTPGPIVHDCMTCSGYHCLY